MVDKGPSIYVDRNLPKTLNSDQLEVANCAGKHGLTQFQAENGDYSCDLCAQQVKIRTPMQGCRVCDKDVCQVCLNVDQNPTEKGPDDQAKNGAHKQGNQQDKDDSAERVDVFNDQDKEDDDDSQANDNDNNNQKDIDNSEGEESQEGNYMDGTGFDVDGEEEDD